MKKIIIYFIILIILSGCSIDWNNQKEIEITRLKNEIEDLKKFDIKLSDGGIRCVEVVSGNENIKTLKKLMTF